MAGKGGRTPGSGRKKGGQNHTTTILKEAILAALDKAGGQAYLLNVAKTDPKTFCSLLGRVLPLQVNGPNGGPIQVSIVDPILNRSNT